jgi:hypothetical protein
MSQVKNLFDQSLKYLCTKKNNAIQKNIKWQKGWCGGGARIEICTFQGV